MSSRRSLFRLPLLAAAAILATGTLTALPAAAQTVNLLNVSYDPTRELYVDYNAAFAKYWKAKAGQDVSIKQSHGGSGKQARSVIDGIDADVVTLGLGGDVDAVANHGGLIAKDWIKRLPHNSSPYTSTIVFLVRKGNPKGIKDWEYAKRQYGGDAKAKEFVGKLYKNVPVLDTGARGSTITFVQRGVGDVLLAWENEAFLALKEFGAEKFQIVAPSISILAEPSVAVVDKNVDKKGTRKVAEAYLSYLYSEEGQDIAGRNFYRPTDAKAKAKYASQFPPLKLFTIDEAFGGWATADKAHFADGGSFDQIYSPR